MIGTGFAAKRPKERFFKLPRNRARDLDGGRGPAGFESIRGNKARERGKGSQGTSPNLGKIKEINRIEKKGGGWRQEQ